MSTLEDKVSLEYYSSLDIGDLLKLYDERLDELTEFLQRPTKDNRERRKQLTHDLDLIRAIYEAETF